MISIILKRVGVTLLLVALVIPLFSKSLKPGQKGGHEADIYSVLPFARSTQIDSLIYIIHSNIDFPIGYFKGLRDAPHQDFTWHRYGHRVFFHWGFNSDPRNGQILQTLVAERNWAPEVEQAFWNKVIAEQGRRNKETMQIVSRTLGFLLEGKQRAFANAFASIITDVHILGDYTTTSTVTLQPVEFVVADIKKALFESLEGGDEAKRIHARLDKTRAIVSNKERAAAVLVILQEELPQFILSAREGWFRRHFQKLGLPLKTQF